MTSPDPRAHRRSPGTPARPPFGFRLTAPPGWEALRGDAASLRDDLVAVVARTPLWDELDDRRRGGLAYVLDGIARASAATGALAVLLHLPDPADPAALTDPTALTDPAVAAITLTWFRTAPVRADLDLARLVLGDGEPVVAGVGPALLTRRVEPQVTGGEQVTVQVAAPVPDSIWLALITGTTTTREHQPALEDAVRRVAAGLVTDAAGG